MPSRVVTYLHPFDLYADELADGLGGFSRLAYRRNARLAWETLVGVIGLLENLGYRFVLMRELAQLSADDAGTRPHVLRVPNYATI